jgi:hypothetical protein
MASAQAIQELIDKMIEEREALLRATASFSEADAGRSLPDAGGEGHWSVKEQLAHLAIMENAYRMWVTRALVEDNPNVTNDRWDSPAIGLAEANEHSTGELVKQLRDLRSETNEVIAALAPEQYDRTATRDMFGTLTILQWLRSYYRHDRMHRAQMLGEESDYKPRYATGVEPDQRVKK